MPGDERILIADNVDQEAVLESFTNAIAEGFLDGVREGAIKGLKQGARDSLKDLLSETPTDIGVADFQKILEDIAQTTVRTAIKETSVSIFNEPAEIYARFVCERIVEAVEVSSVPITEDQIDRMVGMVKDTHQKMMEKLSSILPTNPIVHELDNGFQEAMETALDKEIAILVERLKSPPTG